jgi:phosphoribosyl 1,2-cyclic phosphate phosphodiesterase
MIACECEVCTSADRHDKRLRTSVMIEDEGKVIVIDSGPDFRYQMLREGVKHLDAVVFTHAHKDHTAGLDDVRAFNYKQQEAMNVYATEAVQASLMREFEYIFAAYKYPGIPQLDIHTITTEPFFVGPVKFTPIPVLHYKLPVLGFRVKDVSYITDAKTISPEGMERIRGSRILIVNALQKEPHISHFTFGEAIELAQQIGAETTYFTHISHRLGKYADVQRELPAGIQLAYDGLKLIL